MSTSTWHHSHWSETLHVQGTAVYGEFEPGTVGTIWHSPLTNLLFPPQARRLAPSLECQTQHDKSHRNRKNQFPTAYEPIQNVVPRFPRPNLESSSLQTFEVFGVDQFLWVGFWVGDDFSYCDLWTKRQYSNILSWDFSLRNTWSRWFRRDWRR